MSVAGELHQPRSDDRGIHFIEKLQLGREIHIQVGHRCAGRTGDLRHWAVDKAFCPEKLVRAAQDRLAHLLFFDLRHHGPMLNTNEQKETAFAYAL